jgi:hypothetical protein
LAPTWPDGYLTLARAQREFGEPELALKNLKTAYSLIHQRNLLTESIRVDGKIVISQSDSSLEEISAEMTEVEGIVKEMQDRIKSRGELEREENAQITTKGCFVCQGHH